MDHPRRKFQDHLLTTLLGLFAIWTVKIIEMATDRSLTAWGLFPRKAEGLVGVVTMPFIHGDFDHLFSNSFGLLVLGLCLLHYYERDALKLTLWTVLAGGLLVWLFARPSYHVGASGLIYGWSAFLFLSGVLRRNRRSVAAALIVALLFGGSVWGVLPLEWGVSWEGHLFGAIAGCAYALFRIWSEPPIEPDQDEKPGDEDAGEPNPAVGEPDPYRLYGDLEAPWEDFDGEETDEDLEEEPPPQRWRVKTSRRKVFKELDKDWDRWFNS